MNVSLSRPGYHADLDYHTISITARLDGLHYQSLTEDISVPTDRKAQTQNHKSTRF